MFENVGTILAGITAIFAGVFGFIKWGPELNKMRAETMDVNVKMADGLRDSAWDSFDRVRDEMVKMQIQQDHDRQEARQYREDTENRMLELSTEIRAEKALRVFVEEENVHIKAANVLLIERVANLEQEVASLKAYARGFSEQQQYNQNQRDISTSG